MKRIRISSSIFYLFAALLSGVFTGPLLADDAGVSTAIDFNNEIRPLLQNRCFRCHGPDDESRESDLRLDDRRSAVSELTSGLRAIVPGDVSQSQLIARVSTSNEDLRMPPIGAGPPLEPREVELLTRWIDEGAEYQDHWAFAPPSWAPLPKAVDQSNWARNGIDAFTLARLESLQLSPAPEADRYTLIRRLTLDLTGLPPTIDEVDRFVNDPRPDAYQRLVDRLLQSPAFGERWARVWLDLARYADSAGYAQDPPRVIWRFRDWVISALNDNMPFDQFTVEQLAGDLLPNPTTDQLLATAFHRNTMTNSEGGTDDEEFRSAAVVDRVNTTMQVWMGLTMGCAQCHSHKYDPISQKEYFQLYAILNNTADADRGDEEPTIEELTASQQRQQARLRSEIETLEKHLHEDPSRRTNSGNELSAGPVKQVDDRPELARLRAKIAELEKQRDEIRGVKTPILQELAGPQRRQTHLHVRGNFLNKGELVSPALPSAFHQLPDNSMPTRLDLAHWLTSPNNPLTARVAVNRFWEQLFGLGLVETSEDFGTQGEAPSHPALLDYLALNLVRHEWDLKWLLSEIVTSSTYRQSSRSTPEKQRIDPRNRFLSRGPNFRLSGEMIRDQALAIAGLLSRKMYGPSVRPPRPQLGLRSAFGGSTDWQTSAGEDKYRRGLYTRWRRTTPYPSLTTFDAPSREVCTIRRIRTNTPLQALVTLNDPVFVEAAQGLARCIVTDAGDTLQSRLSYGFRRCLCRPPQQYELERLTQLYHDLLSDYRSDEQAAEKMAIEPLGPHALEIDHAELATWTVISNVLLNLDELLAKL